MVTTTMSTMSTMSTPTGREITLALLTGTSCYCLKLGIKCFNGAIFMDGGTTTLDLGRGGV